MKKSLDTYSVYVVYYGVMLIGFVVLSFLRQFEKMVVFSVFYLFENLANQMNKELI
jgi:hypothetical protein